MLPEPQDGKWVTLLSLGVAQSEGQSSAFLKAGNRGLKTFQYRPTAVETQAQSVVLNHVPEDKHEKLLNWWNCPFV